MSGGRKRRVLLAVIISYLINAVLIAASEQLLRLVSSYSPTPPRSYYVADVLSQCIVQVIAGYVCCVIAQQQRTALAILIGVGVLVGTVFLILSYKAEPLWYSITLLAIYAPGIWIGWALRSGGRETFSK